jgi:hypothetical protein
MVIAGASVSDLFSKQISKEAKAIALASFLSARDTLLMKAQLTQAEPSHTKQ